MTSKVVYKGDLSTEATHLRSGTKIITDAPVDNNGRGQSFSPTDLVATALGSCIMTIMGISARNHGIDMTGAEIEVEKIMHADPRRIGKVNLILQMPQKDYSDKHKKILTAAAKSCPVGGSIKSGIENLEIRW